MYLLAVALFIACSGTNLVAEIHDLNYIKTPYVLETKQIKMPEFPDAFNPCIVQWQGKTLMSFRIRDPNTASTDQIGFVWLTDSFELASAPTILERFNESITQYFYMPSFAQDPRLITLNDELYIIYSNIFPTHSGQTIRRMVVSTVKFDGTRFTVEDPHPLISIDGFDLNKNEKNWVPFIFEDNLLLAYTISPHRVVQPLYMENTCVQFSVSQKLIQWDWGVIRGGTQALKSGIAI